MITFISKIPPSRFFYDSLFSLNELKTEYFRPWKLFVLALGMAFLFYGALFFDYPDWDIGVSVLMGGFAYLLAPWALSTLLKAIFIRPKHWVFHIILCLISWLFVVDWIYVAWHLYAGNTLDIRLGNFYASSYLYLFAGITWLYKGSLKEGMYDIRHNIRVVNT